MIGLVDPLLISPPDSQGRRVEGLGSSGERRGQTRSNVFGSCVHPTLRFVGTVRLKIVGYLTFKVKVHRFRSLFNFTFF